MKTIITTVLLGISGLVSGQKKLDITIIGMAHHFKEDYQELQDFESVKNFITQLNPDIICIEAIPTYDTASLVEVLPNTLKRADQLKDTLIVESAYPLAKYLDNKVPDDGNPDFWKAYNSNISILEGANDFANYDIWNAYFKWFLVEQKGDSLGYFQKYHKDQSSSEFGLIVFPAAQKLGITHLHGIDFRDGEDEFMAANNKVLKKLFFSFKWKPLRVYLKTQKKYKKAEKAGELIEFINSNEFQNSLPKLIDDLPKRLPKSEEARFIQVYWNKRNEIMADRIIQTAKEQSAQKVLLTVGSAHVTHIKRFLEKEGHQVTTYGQILNTKNQ